MSDHGIGRIGIVTVILAPVLALPSWAAGAERISSLLTGSNLRDAVQGTSAVFTRGSVAFLEDGTEVGPGTPRFEPTGISTVIEDAWLTSEAGPGARTLHNGKLLGVYVLYVSSPDSKILWQSDDAVTWEPLYSFAYDLMSVFVTPENAILVCTHRSGPGRLYRSEDGGASFDLVQVLPARAGYVRHWSYDVLDGVIYVGEYGDKRLPNNARHILRSTDDGRTWEIVYAPPEQDDHHVHKVLADPYARCVWRANGDHGNSGIERSCNVGATWESVTPGLAPTSGVARPDGIYWGNDFHVSTWATVDRFDRETGQYASTLYVDQGGYVWDMKDYRHIMYATLYHYQLTVTPTLWASWDGNAWVLLRQYPLGHGGLEIFGPADNGWMYNSYLDGQVQGYRNYRFTIPKIRTVAGLRIEPAVTNLLNSVQLSSAEQDTTGWYSYNWQSPPQSTVSWDNTLAHHGAASIHVTSPPESYRPGVRMETVTGNFPAGSVIMGSLWVSGPPTTSQAVQLRAHLIDLTNGRDGPRLRVHPTHGWHRVVVRQILTAPSTAMTLVIYHNSNTATADFHVDSASIWADARPSSWQVGGTPRADESLTHQIPYPPAWTETWFWEAANASDDPLDRPLVIKSWGGASGEVMWLSYEPADQTFKIAADTGGGTQVLLTTTPVNFRKECLFRIGVTCSPGALELYLFGPTDPIHVTGVSPGVPFDRTWIGSSPASDNQACGLFAYHQTFDNVMSEAQIIGSFAAALQLGDLDGDFDADGMDFLTFGNCFNGSLHPPRATCQNPDADFDGDGDVDVIDFLTFASCFNGPLNPPHCP